MTRISRTSLLIAVPILVAASYVLGQSGSTQTPDRFAALVRAASATSSFKSREAATRELESIGEPARKALEAGVMDDNREIARRAANILEMLDAQVRLATAKERTRQMARRMDRQRRSAVCHQRRALGLGRRQQLEVRRSHGESHQSVDGRAQVNRTSIFGLAIPRLAASYAGQSCISTATRCITAALSGNVRPERSFDHRGLSTSTSPGSERRRGKRPTRKKDVSRRCCRHPDRSQVSDLRKLTMPRIAVGRRIHSRARPPRGT